jgi:hypothetical protein
MEDASWGSRDRGKILTSLCIRCDVADGIDLAEGAKNLEFILCVMWEALVLVAQILAL